MNVNRGRQTGTHTKGDKNVEKQRDKFTFAFSPVSYRKLPVSVVLTVYKNAST